MHPRIILSVGNLFFSIFSALVSMILLPYLAEFIPEAYTGFIVAGSAVVAMCFYPVLPRLVARYSPQQIALVVTIIETVVLLALAAAPGALASVVLMAVTIVVQPLLAYEFDLLLEATLADTGTAGRVRALFRTAWSVGALAAPLLIGALLGNSNLYGRVFVAAAAVLAPLILLFTAQKLPREPAPTLFRIRDTLVHIIRHPDLTAVTVGNLLLYFFYVWAPLYAPYYLHSVIGIPWSTLGLVFFVMLLPYVFVEYPAGWLADRYLGDKELMFIGFVIAGFSLASLSLMTSATPVALILVVLLASRIGSALVEAMVDAHFYRRVSNRDISFVEVFGSAWPLSYLIAPLIGSAILLTSSYQMFFVLTGGFLAIAGGITALFIRDVR